jgi:hypothetical protein
MREPGVLNVSGSLHAGANGLGSLSNSISTQLFIIHAWDFYMNINTIQQGT